MEFVDSCGQEEQKTASERFTQRADKRENEPPQNILVTWYMTFTFERDDTSCFRLVVSQHPLAFFFRSCFFDFLFQVLE